MSHIATIDVRITSLDDLAAACERIGLEFRRNQTTFRYYAGQQGGCEHAISVRDNTNAYEIGVVSRSDGKPGWELHWDSYKGAKGLVDVVGNDCGLLMQSYATVAAAHQARVQGYHVQEQRLQDGQIKLLLSK